MNKLELPKQHSSVLFLEIKFTNYVCSTPIIRPRLAIIIDIVGLCSTWSVSIQLSCYCTARPFVEKEYFLGLCLQYQIPSRSGYKKPFLLSLLFSHYTRLVKIKPTKIFFKALSNEVSAEEKLDFNNG